MRLSSQKCLKNRMECAVSLLSAAFLLCTALATLPAFAAELTGPPLIERIRQGGVVLMMRHAQTTDGVGDPEGFKLNDCATQRNLSGAGRSQALRIGEALKASGIRPTAVKSSAWCRCMDTAQLAFGDFAVDKNLNSFFDDRTAEPRQTEALRARLAKLAQAAPPAIEVWVTHQVNITALTGVTPTMGEIVVLEAGPDLRVIGRLAYLMPLKQ
jgi:phosphohistidine phosphatase SixA